MRKSGPMTDALSPTLRRWCLLAAGASALPLWLQLPGGLATVLAATAVLGVFVQRQLPVSLRLLLTMMLGGLVMAAYNFGIGRDTGCAGLLAMLVLKPFETFSTRDARSLLGFSLFAPFAAFLQDQGPLVWSLCLPAVLLNTMAMAMLTPGASPPSLGWQFRQAGYAALLALPMALAGFWLFPRLAAPFWGLPENATTRMGLGDRMTPNEWLDVLVDDSPALRARFLGATPPREQMYWRGPTLTDFDGQAWVRNVALEQRPPPALQQLAKTIRYEVTLEPTERSDLVLLDLPISAPSDSAFDGDLTAVTSAPINNLIRYVGASSPQMRYLKPLDAWSRRAALTLPANLNPRTRALAQQWRRETPDPQKLTERFLQWIRRDFSYTISAPPVGINATDDFLFETHQGFCQHFSSAFAVFMRAAGIPARVVTGYAGGHYNQIGDYWLIYRKDAHAWTEIWIEGQGWVRVDPTAAVAPDRILDTIDDLQARQRGGLAGLAGGVFAPMFDASDFLRNAWNQMVLGFDAARQKSLLKPIGIKEAENWQLVLAFSIGAIVALALTLWLLLREHRDDSDPLVRAWRRFVRELAGTGYAKQTHEPPLQYVRRLTAVRSDLSPTVLSLGQRYTDWRYAGLELAEDEKAELARRLKRFRLDRSAARSS
jgi:transglutaminase-like putative cysteine protease